MSETEKIEHINGPAQSTRARESHCHKRPKAESEKTLESRLRKEVEKRGGMAIKLLSQLHRGLPDRMVLLPRGAQYFVELKSTGEKPTLLQEHCHKQLRSLGFQVYIIGSSQALADFLFIADCEQLERANSHQR